MYEFATGRLPFSPENGREDVQTMYRMISQKENGQISAVQIEEKIEWSRVLPESSSIVNDNWYTQFLAGIINVSINKITVYNLFQIMDAFFLK